ncbi:tyrosine-type recombinase/integrase [Mycolicibacterium sp. ELW1]|uniref:tyrosine-type recombinase/integrase n=1 Tax=Mycobacteriaceae TaxID=1762 RepID=UPI001AEF97E1|nr:tyrosine-type recombinase/integrase [Mycobacterium sp. ELW1]
MTYSTTVDHRWALLVHGKGDKQRVVPITDRLAVEITLFCPQGYLFPNGVGGHLTPERVGKCISDLLPPGWSMHKLRHRFASRGLAGTGDLLAVRDALGHASVAITQLYTAVADGKVSRVCEVAADDH